MPELLSPVVNNFTGIETRPKLMVAVPIDRAAMVPQG
jgi:hypothetical protein